MTARTVRLIDVARRAGVSVATASFALTGKGRVSEGTRRTVLQIADELGYRVNATAQNLRRGQHGVIGLYLPPDVTRHEYYMEFVFGTIEAADAVGVSVLLLSHDGTARVGVDAVVVVDVMEGDEVVRELLGGPAPVVAADGVPDALPRPTLTVAVDHRRHVGEMLDALAARGRERIALLAPTGTSVWARSLRSAYRQWCAAHDREPILVELPFAVTLQDIDAPLDRLFADGIPDAVLAGPDGTAGPVLVWLREHGYAHVEVAAYVRSAAAQAWGAPTLSLDLRPRDFGRECARLALGLVDRDDPAGLDDVDFPLAGLS